MKKEHEEVGLEVEDINDKEPQITPYVLLKIVGVAVCIVLITYIYNPVSLFFAFAEIGVLLMLFSMATCIKIGFLSENSKDSKTRKLHTIGLMTTTVFIHTCLKYFHYKDYSSVIDNGGLVCIGTCVTLIYLLLIHSE